MRFISQVSGQRDIKTVARLADEIWHEYFVSIIGQAQVDYMLDKFQSVTAITAQIESGQEYYLLSLDDRTAGYLSLISENAGDSVMISKLYVRKNFRGTGAGLFLLEYALHQCRNHSKHSLWLTVNRDNRKAIDWYLKRGFVVIAEKKKDIGGGYFMDDFIMEKKIG